MCTSSHAVEQSIDIYKRLEVAHTLYLLSAKSLNILIKQINIIYHYKVRL